MKDYRESEWIKALRGIAYIILVLGVMGGIYLSWQLASTREYGVIYVDYEVFFITLIVSIVGTLVFAAIVMVILDIASDVCITKQINYDILKTLQQGGIETNVVKQNNIIKEA